MTCGCNDKCELPKALQINNPGEVTLFHRVDIPASQGDDTTYPPKNGLYRNVLLVYLANNHSYLYNSDGVPTRVDGPAGPGTAAGGETGQVLAKRSDADYDTTWVTQTSANDAKLTLTRNNTEIGDFTANASVDKTIDIEVPTKTSDLENDGATGESTYVEATALADYYTKGETDATFQGKLTAGSNITIDANNEISATDTTYTAGNGIEINGSAISAKVREVYNHYTYRPTTADTTPTGNGGMYTFQATSSMTTGKPKNDAHILQLEWDNTSGFDSQIALSSWDSAHWMGYRTMSNGAWGNWLYLLNDEAGSVKTANIDALAVTTAKIANGAITEAKINATDWAKKVNVASIDLTGQTADLLTLTKALGTAGTDYARWTCKYNSAAANISNKPTGSDNESFVCEAYCSRWANSTDYRYNLIAWSTVSNNPYVAYVTNNSSSIAWGRLRPTVNDATLTIQKNGTTVETFTANSSTNKTANITVPTKTSDLTNDGSDNTSTYVEADELQPSYITGEGTDITLLNTQGGRLSDVKLKGNTDQTTYSGKNLFNVFVTPTGDGLSSAGITATINQDGTINTSGVSTAAYQNIRFDFTLPAGTYKFSGCPSGGSINGYSTLLVADQSHWDYGTGGTFTLSATRTISFYPIRLGGNTGLDLNGKVFKPMITVSTASQDFEPYVGGTASPNPDYPQDVNVVAGEQTVKITGKNLFNLTTPATNNGVTITTNADGSFTINGTTTGVSAFTFALPTPQPAGTYTISCTSKNQVMDYAGFFIRARNVNQAMLVNGESQLRGNGSYYGAKTFTSTDQMYYVALNLTATGVTYNNMVIYPQIEKGSTATVFEPYKEQSYTINLGKNLFDKNNAAQVLDGYFVNAGAQTIGQGSGYAVIYIKCEPNTTYTVSKAITSRFTIVSTSAVPANGVSTSVAVETPSSASSTFTTNSSARYLAVMIRSSSDTLTTQQIINTIQIEVGSTATSYASYFTPVELCKIGNYQDYIYKNNGTWYLHKETGKLDLATQSWSSVALGTNTYGFGASNAKVDNSNVVVISDSFLGTAQVNRTQGNNIIYQDGAVSIIVRNTSYTSVSNLVNMLAANDAKAYYVLATPTDTPITGTLLDDLNAFDQATSYQGNTYITVSSVSPDLTAILNVTTEKKGALPIATKTNAGVVSVGDGLEVTDGGVLSLADNVVYSEDPGAPIGEVANPFDYSTTETRIGTWIDGKPLYRRVFTGTASTMPFSVATLTNCNVKNIYGRITYNGSNYHQIGGYANANYYSLAQQNYSNYNIDLYGSSNYVGQQYELVAEYTKTTD